MRRFLSLLSFSALFCFCSAATAAKPGLPHNPIVNGGFEEGEIDPVGWRRDAWMPSGSSLTSDGTQAHQGARSARISAPTANDARWLQTIAVEPDTSYLLSGWIKTAGVTDTLELVNAGANLCLYGTWERSAGVFGTTDWTFVTLVFQSGSRTEVEIGARLGFWAGTATGTAWFDDLRVTPIPLQEIGSLQALVDGLVADGVLDKGAGRALSAKLGAATLALERGQEKTAARILRAFVQQVKALVRSGRLDAASGLALAEATQDVIDRLQSP